MTIRPTTSGDIPALQDILNKTELFPAEMLSDMLAPFLSDEDPDALWLTAIQDGSVVGFCYSSAEMLTDGTWNMRAIAVHPTHQGKGVGGLLAKATEDHLRKAGQRVLIVDTSGTADFEPTRTFYAQNGYDEEARIRDFWEEGDDKVIFRKRL